MIPKKLIKRLLPAHPSDQTLLDRPLCCAPREDFHIFRLIQSHRLAPCHHELSAILSLMGFIGPGMTFVDVGANIGLFATMFASVGERVGFDVVAIEPNPVTFQRLRKTLAGYSNCTLHNVGCSAESGQMVLLDQGDSLTAHLIQDKITDRRSGDRTHSIPVAPLDTLLADRQTPLVIKIDVEGHEREVLAGAGALLQERRIVAMLLDAPGEVNVTQLLDLGYEAFDGCNLQPNDQAYSQLFVLSSAFPATMATDRRS